MSAEQFLQTLLAFPAKSLDHKQIQSIYSIFKETSNIKDTKKPATKKTKSNITARAKCWAEKKQFGMDKDVFKLYWNTMSDEQKSKYE